MSARKKASESRPHFQKITEEMQQWAALLSAEVAQWPDATLKSMFGMTTFYRNKTIFGAVPLTRSLGSENTIIFKISSPQAELKLRLDADSRVQTGNPGHKWYSFELSSPKDLRDALSWFSEAYEKATPASPKTVAKRRKKAS
jgi:hypothetical protein